MVAELDFATPWAIAHQVPLSVGCLRHGFLSGKIRWLLEEAACVCDPENKQDVARKSGALARYSVSKDVPGSVLKCETVLGMEKPLGTRMPFTGGGCGVGGWARVICVGTAAGELLQQRSAAD